MRIHLDEIMCPVCGISHDDHVDREACREAVFDNLVCNDCDDWLDLVHDQQLQARIESR